MLKGRGAESANCAEQVVRILIGLGFGVE